jgi:hypothetical protein
MSNLNKKGVASGIDRLITNFGLGSKYSKGSDELSEYIKFIHEELSYEEITDEQFVRAVKGVINNESKLFSLPSKVQYLKHCTWELETPRKKREVEERKKNAYLEQRKKWDFTLEDKSKQIESKVMSILPNLEKM